MFLTTHIIRMFPNSVNIMDSMAMQCLNSNLNFIYNLFINNIKV